MVFLIEFNGYGFRLWDSPSAGQMKPTIAEGREMSLDFVTLRKDGLSREMKGSSGWGEMQKENSGLQGITESL
jgi:hypothetical protein